VPEFIAATIGAELWAAGAFEAGILVEAYGAAVISAAAFAGSVYTLRDQQRRAQNAARGAYNASLRDRYVMVRSATAPRQIILGRVRASGVVCFIASYGTNSERLVMAVALAAHQIDAVESVWFDNEKVQLDSAGSVIAVNREDTFSISAATLTVTLSSAADPASVSVAVAYGGVVSALSGSLAADGVTLFISGALTGATGTVTVTYHPAASPWVSSAGTDLTTAATTDAAGGATVILDRPPATGSLRVYLDNRADQETPIVDYTATASVSGAVVTIAGAPPGLVLTLAWRDAAQISRARVRSYLGAPGQAADAGMIAALPGVWTSAHKMTGIAYLVVELDYNADAFPSGLPNVSAVCRGALCFDPRTSTTAWSQNPALLMRYAATSPLLGRMPAAAINDLSIAAAANVCDSSAAYSVSGQTYTRPLYTAGLVTSAAQRCTDVLTDLATAMAGKWAFSDGLLIARAGAYYAPIDALDESWLSDATSVQVQGSAARIDLVNTITGRFADEQRGFIEVPMPRVIASAYLAADGVELPLDISFAAVTFSGQAQQVAACLIREARLGLRIVLSCNARAIRAQLFDVLSVTLPRFGLTAAPMEVQGATFTLDGAIQLTLKQVDPTIWALGSVFGAPAIPPHPGLRSPWQVPTVDSLGAASGTAQLLRQLDGTVASRILVSWTPISDPSIQQAGGVEVRWGRASLPDAQWQSVIAERGQSVVFLAAGILDGQTYAIKARAFNTLVRGPWTATAHHTVVGKSQPPSSVAGFAAVSIPGGVLISWTPATDLDYQETELRIGAAWATATRIFVGPAASYVWPWPAAGAYTIRARHRDTSNNESLTDALALITVGDTSLIGTGQLGPGAATQITQDTFDFAGGGFGRYTARSFSITPTVDCAVEFTATITADGINPDSGTSVAWWVTPAGGSALYLGGSDFTSSGKATYPVSCSFNAAAGAALLFELKTNVGDLGITIHLYKSSARITQIRR
jgi:hypothetical protein